MNRPPDSPILLVYLDRYHLGDPLFLQRFAPVVRAHEGPLVVLHGAGEAAERALEAEGRLVARAGGVLQVEDEAGRALVERSARDLNRHVVHALNEAGVAALRLTGMDRGLLRVTEGGEVAVGRVGWLRTLVLQGAVPAVALLAEGAGGAFEVSPDRAVAALAEAFGEEDGVASVAVLLARSGPRRGGDEGEALLRAVAEPETARGVSARGVRVRVARPEAIRGTGVPAGADYPEGGE